MIKTPRQEPQHLPEIRKDYSVPFSSEPVYPELLQVQEGKEAFTTRLVTKKSFKAGDVVCDIKGATFVNTKSWTTVQVAKDKHIELNSELVYLNHSCNPSVRIDVEKMQLVALRDLKAGDELCFFYPSTEWQMSQPFTCWCGAENCLKTIDGASNTPRLKMDQFFYNKHIRELLDERDSYQVPFDKAPVYPDVLEIVQGQDFASKAVSKKSYKKDQLICDIVGVTDGVKRWTSVQVDIDRHIELNSELVYMNHSCDPSVRLDTVKMQVIANKDIQPGDELNFFYPSTEWKMSQPFNCWCGAKNCLKVINGASSISDEVAKGFYFTQHINELFKRRS